MQTFLPSWSFIHTASILDNRRLNKQIVEAYQIWSGRVPTKNHPACLMWSGYKDALLFYIETLLNEYVKRTHKCHAVYDNIKFDISRYGKESIVYPEWFGNKIFHLYKCVNLIRKDKTYYYNRDFFCMGMIIPEYDVSDYPTGYYWPVCPIGKKAQKDTMAWINWYSNHFNVDIN